eukprot:6415668-Ditylum_brightwellii.AAC.1
MASSTTATTTYHQQLALQQMKTSSTVNPHKRITSDLLQWMKSAKSCGELFILGGDFNETLHSTLGGLTNSQFSTMNT